jgi:protein-S-isoprenylcysteine O-methyltransferase Ste14
VVSFRRARTTVNPTKPESSSVLVDSGIYRLTRNPMYLGFSLGLSGWAVMLSNMFAFLLLPIFILYMDRFQIEPEEKALAAIFGRQFAVYKTRVRRWL